MSYLVKFFVSLGLSEKLAGDLSFLCALFLIILLSLAIKYIFEKFFVRFLQTVISQTTNMWDVVLVQNGLPRRIALLIPAVLIYYFITLMFPEKPSSLIKLIYLLCRIYIISIFIIIVDSVLNSIVQIYEKYEVAAHTPIKSFVQMIKVVMVFVALVVVISLLMRTSPWNLLKALGALTAVAMLVFKDAILGFVAGIQLSAQRMVRKGDWIEMPQFGANGDVIDISLTTVKVQNFDKTIVNVPTYALVSNSFQNWRGMIDAGGRRIKRAINLDMNSFKFLDRSDIEHLKRFEYLGEYLNGKESEIISHNEKIDADTEQLPINGRRLTNVGTFRHYVKQYLLHHSKIHNNMTFMIRQLQPTEKGLPLEIYVFANDVVWANYEEIQSDIFDHILTSVPEFGLSVYQDPTGFDFRKALTP